MHNDDAAAAQEILEMDERLGEIRARARLGLLDGVEQAEEAVPGAWTARRSS